jgi:hypothetical protein
VAKQIIRKVAVRIRNRLTKIAQQKSLNKNRLTKRAAIVLPGEKNDRAYDLQTIALKIPHHLGYLYRYRFRASLRQGHHRLVLKARTEGMSLNATVRTHHLSKKSMIAWEGHLEDV